MGWWVRGSTGMVPRRKSGAELGELDAEVRRQQAQVAARGSSSMVGLANQIAIFPLVRLTTGGAAAGARYLRYFSPMRR